GDTGAARRAAAGGRTRADLVDRRESASLGEFRHSTTAGGSHRLIYSRAARDASAVRAASSASLSARWTRSSFAAAVRLTATSSAAARALPAASSPATTASGLSA